MNKYATFFELCPRNIDKVICFKQTYDDVWDELEERQRHKELLDGRRFLIEKYKKK